MPVCFLNSRQKYKALSYPTISAISLMFLLLLSKYPLAAAILRETMYCIGGICITFLKLCINQLTLIKCSCAYFSIDIG